MYKQGVSSRRQKYLLPVLYFTVLLGYCGANLGEAPRTQMVELIICQNQYGDIPFGDGKDSLCKSREVQEELAFLRGMDRLLGAVPTIVAIPYSYFGEKYGRSVALSLALFGTFLGELWSIIICWFSNILPIRLILLASVFQFVGGGAVIISTMLHLIGAEHVTEEFRTNVFFHIKAICALAVFSEQLIASTFMKYNFLWTPMLVGLVMLIVATGLVITILNSLTKVEAGENCVDDLTPLLSEESSGTRTSYQDTNPNQIDSDERDGVWVRLKTSIREAKVGFFLIFANFQLLLLLSISFVSDLSEASVNVIFLLYTSKTFGWDFAYVNYLSALSQCVQFGFLVLVLPFLSMIMISRYNLSPHTKDHVIAISSSTIFLVGSLLLGFGSQIWVVIIGLLVFTTASGMQSVLRSIITSSISPTDISIVYSVFTILHVLSGSLAGPLYSGTFSAGMKLGGVWLGLPFLVGGGLALLALGGIVLVREKEAYEPLIDDGFDS